MKKGPGKDDNAPPADEGPRRRIIGKRPNIARKGTDVQGNSLAHPGPRGPVLGTAGMNRFRNACGDGPATQAASASSSTASPNPNEA